MDIKTETHYVWREHIQVAGEEPRLLVPWRDPELHEFPFDLMFDSPEEAIRVKAEYGVGDVNWILCIQTIRPLTLNKKEK